MTLRRVYSAGVVRFFRAASSIAFGNDAGQRMWMPIGNLDWRAGAGSVRGLVMVKKSK